MFTELVAA